MTHRRLETDEDINSQVVMEIEDTQVLKFIIPFVSADQSVVEDENIVAYSRRTASGFMAKINEIFNQRLA